MYEKGIQDYTKGIQDYTKAIQINPNNDVPYSRRAINYENLENYDLAQKDCEKALQINPNNVVAHYATGKVHYARGKYQEAIDAYEKALELTPDYGPASFDKEIAERMLTHQSKTSEAYTNIITSNEADIAKDQIKGSSDK